MSFEENLHNIRGIIKTARRQFDNGKFGSIDFRTLSGALRKLRNSANSPEEIDIVSKIEDAYAKLKVAKSTQNKAEMDSIRSEFESITYIFKDATKRVQKTSSEVRNSKKRFSDTYPQIDQEPEIIKGTPEEEAFIHRLVNTAVSTRNTLNSSGRIARLNKIIKYREQKNRSIDSFLAALEVEKKKNADVIVALLNNELRTLKSSSIKSTNGLFATALDVILQDMYGDKTAPELIRDIGEQQDFSNLQKKPKPKKNHTKGAQSDERGLVGLYKKVWTALQSQSPEARHNRKAQGTIDTFIEWFLQLDRHKKIGGHKESFKQLMFNTIHANLAAYNMSMDDLDGSINDTFAITVQSLKQILESDHLGSLAGGVYKKVFKKDSIKVLDDLSKLVAVFRNWTPLSNGFFMNSKGAISPLDSMLADVTDNYGVPLSEDSLKEYSTVLTLYRGLGVTGKTPYYMRMWNDIIKNGGVDLNKLGTIETLNSGKFHEFGENTLKGILGNTTNKNKLPNVKDYIRADMKMKNRRRKVKYYPTVQKELGGLPEVSYRYQKAMREQFMRNFMGWAYKTWQDFHTKKLGGATTEYLPGRHTDIIPYAKSTWSDFSSIHGVQDEQEQDSIFSGTDFRKQVYRDSKSLGKVLGQQERPKKSSSQTIQDNKDRRRQEQKSFISLLIPELKKLLPKKVLWDALKLLLFRFGAVHPKLAAAALLAGPAVAGGLLRFAGRSLLGLPGLAKSGSAAAKIGTFSGPISNIKNWWGGILSNNFSHNGLFANLQRNFTNISKRQSTLNNLTPIKPNTLATTRQLKHLELLEKSTTKTGIFGSYMRSIGNGFMGNAKWNWAKYSNKGAVGTLGTLKNAAKGVPGFAALLEVISDIPDVVNAAMSGKKGELVAQLSKTLGGALGAIVGAFFGPIGLILGPLIGRSIGAGFGKHAQGIGEAFGRLGNAFNELIKVCEPLIKLFKVSFGGLGEVVAGLLMGFVDGLTALLSALATAAHHIRMLFDKDYKKQYEERERQEKYIKRLGTPGTPEYKRQQEKAEDLLRKEYRSLSYEERTGNTLEFRESKSGFKLFDFSTASQDQLDAINKSKAEAKAAEDDYVKEHLEKKTAELVGKEISRTKNVMNVNQVKAVLGSGALATVAATAAGNTTGECLKYVENAFEKTYGYNLGRHGSAADAAVELDKYASMGLVERHSWKEYKTGNGVYGGLKNLPANAIVVWSKGNSQHGHISIANGNGKEISDHIQDQMTSHYGGGVPTVYIPKMDTKLTQGQINELKTNYINNVTKTSTIATSTTSTPAEARTTSGAREALMKLAGVTEGKKARDEMQSIIFDPTDITGSMGCWGVVPMNNVGQMATHG